MVGIEFLLVRSASLQSCPLTSQMIAASSDVEKKFQMHLCVDLVLYQALAVRRRFVGSLYKGLYKWQDVDGRPESGTVCCGEGLMKLATDSYPVLHAGTASFLIHWLFHYCNGVHKHFSPDSERVGSC